MEEVNEVTLQLSEDGHVRVPTAMSADASDQEFYLRKSIVCPSARPPPFTCPPVYQSANPSACPPVRAPAHPRPPVRPSAHCPPPSARPSARKQDCGFSLEDPLCETHCTGGHPAFVRGHGIVLEYYVVLCLVKSVSRACPLCHSVS